MPRKFWSMSELLKAQRDQDRRVTEALDEARAKRDLRYDRLGFPLTTKRRER